VDEVIEIQAITYNRKRIDIMKKTTKKRRITLDSSILITKMEKLISTEHAKTSELINTGMKITDATLDRARKDEHDMASALKEFGASAPFGEILSGLHIGHSILEKLIPIYLQQIHEREALFHCRDNRLPERHPYGDGNMKKHGKMV
jgi:hypothetical protein